MSRLFVFCLIVAAAASGFTACNSLTEDTLEYDLSSSTLIKGFYISEDDDVLANLENVFFTIDLASASIYNADSMPYGTDIHALVPVITTVSNGVSALELIVPRPGMSDSIYNYLENSTDSIDFSNGPVTIRVRSLSGESSMDYSVKVNVHTVKSDSLAWGEIAYTSLPTTLSNVTRQQTVKCNGTAYCLTTDGSNYCISSTDNPGERSWNSRETTFGFTPRIETLRASSDALYILDTARNLYRSADGGISWTSTQRTFDYLIGGYGNSMIGTIEENGIWSIASTDGQQITAPEDFPVRGSSIPVEYAFPMSDQRQMTITGGRTAAGALTGASWAFDGSYWARISNRLLPEAIENTTVVPYFAFEENEYWTTTKYSTFIAIGGSRADGTCNDTTYISYDYGMNWYKAGELMQLPDYVPAMTNAQALVFSTVNTVAPRSSDGWHEMETPMLPSQRWRIIDGMPGIMPASRASEPIRTWECPYIYVFGGENESGDTYDTVWRAVINRFTFEPLQ